MRNNCDSNLKIHTPKSPLERGLRLQWINELLLKFWCAADLEVIPLLRGGTRGCVCVITPYSGVFLCKTTLQQNLVN